jgi:hypothetical protein
MDTVGELHKLRYLKVDHVPASYDEYDRNGNNADQYRRPLRARTGLFVPGCGGFFPTLRCSSFRILPRN